MSASAALRPFFRWMAFLSAVGMALLFALLNSLPAALPITSRGAFSLLLASFALSLPVMALPLLPCALGEGGRLRRWLSPGRVRAREGLPSLLGFALMALGSAALAATLAPTEEQATVRLLAALSPPQLAVMAFFLCVLTPLAEECLFRGILLEAGPPALALPLSAGLFAFAHGADVFVFPLFFVGWCLGLVALRTRSLLPCILLHGVFNLVSLLMA